MPLAKAWRRLARSAAAMAAAVALALLFWWLPARARTGYYIPDTRGVVSMVPPDLTAFWVRPWPWDTKPPPADVTLDLPGGQISAATEASPVSFFAPRAVAVNLRIDSIASALQAGSIAGIGVSWPGGAVYRPMRHLWAVPAGAVAGAPGFAAMITSALPEPVWPLAVTLNSVPEDVLAVAAANPTAGPWRAPRCVSVPDVVVATEGTPQHLTAVLRAMTPGACRAVKGPEVLVLAGRPPKGPIAYVFEPILEVRRQGRTTTVAQTDFLSGTGLPPTAFNWWRFVEAAK